VDFRLTDEQELLVDTARALFAEQCPSAVVRAAADDPSVAQALYDKHLRDWAGLAGGPAADLALFLVEAGAAVAPGPFLATTGLFAPLLVAAGHPLSAAAVAGEATGTVAQAGSDGMWWPSADGVRTQVIDAHLVDYVAVVVPGPALAVVPAGELDVRPVETLDLARRSFVVEVPAGLPVDAVDLAALDDALERVAVAVAAELVGVARWLVETSVAYARDRIQFGRPIGSFQAIQHMLVDMALAHEEAAAAVAYAARCIDAGDDARHRAVHVAKAQAGLAARRAARDGLQVHGGIGFTWEHDLHLRLRRAYADDALCGTHEWHLDRLADQLFDGPPPAHS
jgi:alkylation response protein AidB-like acyl-CoA dehydrogenase